ncbi:hypothetical protein H1C71_016860, partial [Ictidomys tridecemlineatus]
PEVSLLGVLIATILLQRQERALSRVASFFSPVKSQLLLIHVHSSYDLILLYSHLLPYTPYTPPPHFCLCPPIETVDPFANLFILQILIEHIISFIVVKL